MYKSAAVILICAFVAYVQSYPQFDQQYQQEPQSKAFAVLEGRFHQDPNLEYNFA